jgi:hypothetical protein
MMTSGLMKCPNCCKEFRYAGFKTDHNWQDVWVEYPEPWYCSNCKSYIVTDKEKGYGLKTIDET